MSLALKPACANVDETLINSDELTPRPEAKPAIVFCSPAKPLADSPVTCCNLTNSLSNATKALAPCLTALVNPRIIPAEILKAANLRTAIADCLPNSSIWFLACPT